MVGVFGARRIAKRVAETLAAAIARDDFRKSLRRWAPALVPLAALAVAIPALIGTQPQARPAEAALEKPTAAVAPASQPSELAAFEPEIRSELAPPADAASARRAGEPDAADAGDSFDCLIEPSQVVEIGSPVVGLIEKIHVERADLVSAGQLLVELESSAERASVELARARAAMDGAERARIANVRLGRNKEARAHQLSRNHVISKDLREEAETGAELARLELQQAREDRRIAALQLAQTEELLRRRSILSPISGVVVERMMSPGERVDEESILRIAQLGPLRVEVTLPSTSFGTLKPGMQAAVEPEIPGNQVYVASVAIVDRVIDAASGTFGVRLDLPNPNYEIPSGLHCRVRFLEP